MTVNQKPSFTLTPQVANVGTTLTASALTGYTAGTGYAQAYTAAGEPIGEGHRRGAGAPARGGLRGSLTDH